jgi:hypothetical protein
VHRFSVLLTSSPLSTQTCLALQPLCRIPTRRTPAPMPKANRHKRSWPALQTCDTNTQTSDNTHDSCSEVEIDALESRICELEGKHSLLCCLTHCVTAFVAQVAQSGNSQTQDAAPAPYGSIERPRRALKVPMWKIQQDLGYDKTQWNSFNMHVFLSLMQPASKYHTCRPTAVMLQHLSASIGVKIRSHSALISSRRPSMQCVIYHIIIFFCSNLQIEEEFPETHRFKGQWAIDCTMKQFWGNHKTYRSCANNKSTYCSKQAAARHATRTATSEEMSRMRTRG